MRLPFQCNVLHARNERRDADAAADPDLPGRIAVEVEAAVGPLDFHFLPNVQPFAQLAGMVAQRLGDDRDATQLIVPAGRDGVRVRAFGAIRRYEGELAGLVTGPAVWQLDLRLEGPNAGIVVKRDDPAPYLPSGADAA